MPFGPTVQLTGIWVHRAGEDHLPAVGADVHVPQVRGRKLRTDARGEARFDVIADDADDYTVTVVDVDGRRASLSIPRVAEAKADSSDSNESHATEADEIREDVLTIVATRRVPLVLHLR